MPVCRSIVVAIGKAAAAGALVLLPGSECSYEKAIVILASLEPFAFPECTAPPFCATAAKSYRFSRPHVALDTSRKGGSNLLSRGHYRGMQARFFFRNHLPWSSGKAGVLKVFFVFSLQEVL